MARLGVPVTVAASRAGDICQDYLAGHGIEVCVLEQQDYSPSWVGCKVANWLHFYNLAWKYIGQLPDSTLLWIGSADTALALSSRLLKRRYVLQLHELYDDFLLYKWGLRPFARNARCIVTPERNRAAIVQYWYRLDTAPVVLPNKPTKHGRCMLTDAPALAALQHLDPHSKIVLYQGYIRAERDIRSVASVVSELGDRWRFVVMGKDEGFLRHIRAVCPNVVYIPAIEAPLHLQVTTRAFVGVITYTKTSLNHLFCAPNKVWEYAGAGVPMLCDDLPGLRCVADAGAGAQADFLDRHAVRSCLLRMEREYDRYRSAALRMFDSVDIDGILRQVLIQCGFTSDTARLAGQARYDEAP
ncbi:MAG: hypothetical protein ACR2JB_00690 [Bryobacteraceae bacterium]